jgi:hypothetical protein
MVQRLSQHNLKIVNSCSTVGFDVSGVELPGFPCNRASYM